MIEVQSSDSKKLWGGLIDMPHNQIIQIIILGGIVGIIAWVFDLIIYNVFMVPLFCGDPTSNTCVSSPGIAANMASVVASIFGLLGLVRISVFRPLLIAVAVIVSVWGFGDWTGNLPWYESFASSVIIFALMYFLFSWLVRPRAFIPAIILVVIAVLLIRFAPML